MLSLLLNNEFQGWCTLDGGHQQQLGGCQTLSSHNIICPGRGSWPPSPPPVRLRPAWILGSSGEFPLNAHGRGSLTLVASTRHLGLGLWGHGGRHYPLSLREHCPLIEQNVPVSVTTTVCHKFLSETRVKTIHFFELMWNKALTQPTSLS